MNRYMKKCYIIICICLEILLSTYYLVRITECTLISEPKMELCPYETSVEIWSNEKE